ncbi:MAG TPA: hypothetical protein VMF31_10660 [Solirubrobacterales bacterium]|nr:hypothetical protein [Solirubrobacterales bacterium]
MTDPPAFPGSLTGRVFFPETRDPLRCPRCETPWKTLGLSTGDDRETLAHLAASVPGLIGLTPRAFPVRDITVSCVNDHQFPIERIHRDPDGGEITGVDVGDEIRT